MVGVDRLSSRFLKFAASLDGFESIDELLKGNEPHGRKRADYLFMQRSIIVEQKTLQYDPSNKPQEFVEKLLRDRGIIMWGKRSTNDIFSRLPDGDALKAKMFDRLTAQLDTDVAHADKQTRDTRQLFQIPDATGVLVILNENAKTLTPDIIRYGLARAFIKKRTDGSFRYPNNTGVIVLSHIHSIKRPGNMTLHPILEFSHPSQVNVPQFERFSKILIECWSAFNGVTLLPSTHEELFTAK